MTVIVLYNIIPLKCDFVNRNVFNILSIRPFASRVKAYYVRTPPLPPSERAFRQAEEKKASFLLDRPQRGGRSLRVPEFFDIFKCVLRFSHALPLSHSFVVTATASRPKMLTHFRPPAGSFLRLHVTLLLTMNACYAHTRFADQA